MSPVAVQCLSILERQRVYDEARDDVEREMLAIRSGLLARPGVSPETLFPRYFVPGGKEDEPLEDRVEQDDLTPEVNQDLEAWLASRQGTISGAELMEDEEGWQ